MNEPNERLIAYGGALKALSNERVGGYLAVWGTADQPDLQGEYFTPETDFGLEWYTERPLIYHHGLDATVKAQPIGRIDTLKLDDVGLWMEAQLDQRNQYVQAILKLIERGALGLSSGAVPHLVEVVAGQIKKWVIIEGSATPTPAEPRTALSSLKALDDAQGLKGLLDNASEEAAPAPDAKADALIEIEIEQPEPEESDNMTPELLNMFMQALNAAGVVLTEEQAAAVMAQFEQATADMPEAEVEAVAAYMADDEENKAVPAAASKAMNLLIDIARRVGAPAPKTGLVAAAKAAASDGVSRAVGATRMGGRAGMNTQPAYNVRVASKFDSLNPEEMAFLHIVRRGAANKNLDMSTEFYRALADKVERGNKSVSVEVAQAIRGIKANELDHSTQSGYGDEWVPTMWSSSLWERMRVDNVIASSLNALDMPANPFELPTESTDPTVYFVPETTAESQLLISGAGAVIPDSKVATNKVTLTAKKFALRVGYSTELEEDSLIPFASELNRQAQRAILNAIDNAIVNGDSDLTANTNINLIDGTPGGTEIYAAFDGLRKLGLVTTTANSVNAGGVSPTLALIRQTRFTLGSGYAVRPGDLRMVCDVNTYGKLLSMPEFITVDKAGSLATAQTGMVGFIDGIPVFPSVEMSLANSAGKIPAAGGTLGSLVIFAPYAWRMGYRRRINISTEYLPYYESYQLTATVRAALARIDADCSAVLYNLAV